MITRRRLIGGLALAGAGSAVGLTGHPGAAEPPPETTRIRLVQTPSMCQAPQYIAEDLLRGEGFAGVEYVKKEGPYDLMRQVLKDIPYNRWRDYNPEDTVRFYSLRLHEAGMIKSSPQKIIAQGTEWRFLNELRKELKA
jgi:hypothetical protein